MVEHSRRQASRNAAELPTGRSLLGPKLLSLLSMARIPIIPNPKRLVPEWTPITLPRGDWSWMATHTEKEGTQCMCVCVCGIFHRLESHSLPNGTSFPHCSVVNVTSASIQRPKEPMGSQGAEKAFASAALAGVRCESWQELSPL